jgi:DNA processing protein
VAKREAQSLFVAAPLPTAKLGAGEQLACLRLIRSENVGPVTFRELINHYGGAAAALDALPDLSRRGGRMRSIKLCTVSAAEAELEAANKAGAVPLFTIEPGYPAILAAIDAPPPLLYVKGRVELLNKPAVAVVGSRLCSAAGAKVAGLFAQGLGAAGYVVISGLARGIDGVAHQTALSTGTVAVIAGGIDVIYPPEHAQLYERIGNEGCLVSERPPGLTAREKDFPRRNRIISGLSLGVVIVEAAARSGTLTTARLASEQGREVFAVPGHPLDPRAEGTNNLIKNGAILVTEPQDVVAALQPISGLADPSVRARWQPVEPLPPPATGIPPEVGGEERDMVLSALGPAPVDLDALVRATGLPLRTVRIALVELDLAGRIARPGPGLVALNPG